MPYFVQFLLSSLYAIFSSLFSIFPPEVSSRSSPPALSDYNIHFLVWTWFIRRSSRNYSAALSMYPVLICYDVLYPSRHEICSYTHQEYSHSVFRNELSLLGTSLHLSSIGHSLPPFQSEAKFMVSTTEVASLL